MSDLTPPPVLVETPVEEQPVKRQPAGWIILAIVFALLVTMGFAGSFQTTEGPKQYRTEEAQLRSYLLMKKLTSAGPAMPGMSNPDKDVKAVLPDLLKDAPKEREAAALHTVISHELKQKPNPKALASLRTGEQERTRNLAAIYSQTKLTPEQAKSLTNGMDEGPLALKLAKVHAYEKAGIEPSGRDDLAPMWKLASMVGMILLLLLFMVVGLGAWITFFSMRSQGNLMPQGLPLGKITAADADRLALKAAVVILGFVIFSNAMAAIRPEGASPLLGVLPQIGVLAVIVALNKMPILGRKITLGDLGVNKQNLGRNLLWGFLGFCAELPIALGLTILGSVLFKFLPPPQHPATNLLQSSQSVVVVMTVLLLASIMAPIWEEIMFRGMLFPAFSRPLGILGSALFTSFLFAAIHPQGLVLWLGLGTIAAVSCGLVYHTRSLVPSIVMHALHNTTILLLGLSIT